MKNVYSYEELLSQQQKYGITKEDVLTKDSFDKVLSNVVIAPWWGVNIFENHGFEITKINEILFNLKKGSIEFSYLQIKLIGAPTILDRVLRLGVTKLSVQLVH